MKRITNLSVSEIGEDANKIITLEYTTDDYTASMTITHATGGPEIDLNREELEELRDIIQHLIEIMSDQ